MDFDAARVASTFKGSWKNAQAILNRHGVQPHPMGVPNCYVVASLTSSELYVIDKNRRACTCPMFKKSRCCAHVIAAASYGSFLDSVIDHIKAKRTNLADLVSMPEKSGRKPGAIPRKRSNTPLAPGARSNFSNPFTDKENNLKTIELVFLTDTNAFKCYGCKKFLRLSGSSPAPPPPDDIVLKVFLIRTASRKGLKFIFSREEEPTYFHNESSCLKKKQLHLQQDNILIQPETLAMIADEHRNHFLKEFGIFI